MKTTKTFKSGNSVAAAPKSLGIEAGRRCGCARRAGGMFSSWDGAEAIDLTGIYGSARLKRWRRMARLD